ncbi:MAG: AraC family transcriptional regulator [Alphaproteobacteria bacterium]|nr:AraC family transcriptional regulator [Alphaproteobacteria bacterium]
MNKFDRLSALMQHFQMNVAKCDAGCGNLIVIGDRRTNRPDGLEFWPRQRSANSQIPADRRLFEASADWGGTANPLIAALPEILVVTTGSDEPLALLLQMLVTEAADARCGSNSAVNRLCEVLIIRLLRQQIELGETTPGLLAGLADRRISRALVAMHEDPGREWRNHELAEVAGMSLSRFADRFVERTGETPQTYLRRWRMILARQEIAAGRRIQSVARRLGYGSAEALSRAFRRHFGLSPMLVRKSAQT